MKLSDFTILKELYRSRGSRDQRFVDENDPNVEDRRKFYIVQAPDRKMWVKQYLGNLGNIQKEYDSTVKHRRPWAVYNDMLCRAVWAYGMDEDCIFFEYLDGYEHFEPNDMEQELITEWVSLHKIQHYDLCHNNVLKKDNEIVMIDFEYSVDRSVYDEMGL